MPGHTLSCCFRNQSSLLPSLPGRPLRRGEVATGAVLRGHRLKQFCPHQGVSWRDPRPYLFTRDPKSKGMLPSALFPAPPHHTCTSPSYLHPPQPGLPVQNSVLLRTPTPRAKDQGEEQPLHPQARRLRNILRKAQIAETQPCPCLLHPAPNMVPKLPEAKKASAF